MIKEIMGLGGFRKTYPVALISTIFMLVATYFLNKGNASATEQIIALIVTLVSFVLFLFAFSMMGKTISAGVIAEQTEEESPSLKEIASAWRTYFFPTSAILIIYVLAYTFLLPAIAFMAGDIFQVSITGFSFNILTFVLNLCLTAWLMFGIAEINMLEASFLETVKFTFDFAFTHFKKMLGFMFIFIVVMFIVQLVIVSTATGNQLIFMPIKALVIAYSMAFLISIATNLFYADIDDMDIEEEEEEEEED